MPISSNARIAPSRSRSLKLLVCAPICTPAMTEFGGVEASSGTAAAAASLLKSRLEYTGFTSLSLPTYHAARRRAILTSGTVAGGSAPVVMFGFSANRSAAADESRSHGIDRTQDLHRCGFRRTGDHRLERPSTKAPGGRHADACVRQDGWEAARCRTRRRAPGPAPQQGGRTPSGAARLRPRPELL